MKTETLHVTETEERILNAALKVVNDVTISGTRMHLIAEKADMVQSNVHYYYKTKQELLKGLQEWILEECYDMQQVSKKSSKDTLEDQLHIFFQQKKILLTKKMILQKLIFLFRQGLTQTSEHVFRKHMRFGEIISGRSLFVFARIWTRQTKN